MAPLPILSHLESTILPTLTTLTTNLLSPRQDNNPPTITIITSNPSTADPDNTTTALTGGAIAGIVIGSIAGLLLLIWIIRSCTNLGAPPNKPALPGKPWYGSVRDEYYPPRHRSRSRSRRGHHHHHHHAGARTVSWERRVGMAEVKAGGPEGPVYVRRESRSRSRGRGVEGGYAVYGSEEVRGGSRSQGGY